jgi:hypothetical protein
MLWPNVLWITLILSAIAFSMHRIFYKKRKPFTPANNEEKLLLQVQQNYDRFSTEKSKLKRKQLYSYFKKLKIILVVYIREKYNVTVSNRISEAVQKRMHTASNDEILFLQTVLSRLSEVKSKALTCTNIDQLYLDVMNFFQSKSLP